MGTAGCNTQLDVKAQRNCRNWWSRGSADQEYCLLTMLWFQNMWLDLLVVGMTISIEMLTCVWRPDTGHYFVVVAAVAAAFFLQQLHWWNQTTLNQWRCANTFVTQCKQFLDCSANHFQVLSTQQKLGWAVEQMQLQGRKSIRLKTQQKIQVKSMSFRVSTLANISCHMRMHCAQK